MGALDVGIAVGGLLLLATAAGSLVYLQEFSGLEEVSFPVTMVSLQEQDLALVAGENRIRWPLPEGEGVGAFGAHVAATITFTGQATVGGDAIIEAVLHGPDGATRHATVQALTIEPGATTATQSIALELDWAPKPADQRANPGRIDESLRWEAPLLLVISVDRPGDPVGTYGFAATVTGEAKVYQTVG